MDSFVFLFFYFATVAFIFGACVGSFLNVCAARLARVIDRARIVEEKITRSSGEDIATRVFARHGIAMPAEARQATDAFLERLVGKAAE